MTMLPIPSASPLDLVFNAGKIDEAVNSSALTYTDRFGVVRRTLAGAISAIAAVNVRGAWVTATVYNPQDVVSSGGSWYICISVHTSGATFAGDLAARWRVYQGVTASELSGIASALQGAGLVGFDAALSYSAGTTGATLKANGISIATLVTAMANIALFNSPVVGAGMVGYSSAQAYAADTVGFAVKSAGGGARVRALPTGFTWAGILPTICLAPGAAQWTEGVSAYAKRVHAGLIGSGTVWVDPVNGSDAAAGTEYQPVQTIEYAVRTLNPSTIYCRAGEYRPFQFRSTDVQGAKLKIVIALGECVVREAADDAATVTWTVDGTYANVYYMALTPANRPPCALLDTSVKDATGQSRTLTKYTSKALLDASANGAGWWYDSGANRLYARYGTGVNINTTIKSRLRLVTGDANSRLLLYGAKLLMQGRWHFEGMSLLPAQLSGARAILYLDVDSTLRPTVAYNIAHGLDALGADSYMQGAWLHRNQGDNFHYADDGGINCRSVEINCKATFAGDISTIPTAPNTSNGSSIHGTSSVLRINGFYAYNYGPDVVDTGTGYSWNVGSITDSLPSAGNSVGFYTTCSMMSLDTCAARGAVEADIRAENAPMQLYATSYRTQSLVGTGTIAAYLP